MNYRKIVPSAILGFCAIVLAIVLVVKSNFLTILAILVPLMIIGAIAIIIAGALGQGKKIYKIAGAVAAWVIFFLVWLLWSPETFNLAVHTGAFWVFQTFLVINLALLGRTGMMVVFVQTVTIIIIIVSLFSLIANFIKGGPELISSVRNDLMKTTVLAHVKKIEMLDKERQVESLLEKLEKLERKARNGRLEQSDQKELQQVEVELEKIHPSGKPRKQPEKQKKVGRHLSGIFKIPAGSGIYETEIWCEKGSRGWFKSESEAAALLWDDKRKKEIRIPYQGKTYPCTESGKLQFVKQDIPTRVSYKISSSS